MKKYAPVFLIALLGCSSDEEESMASGSSSETTTSGSESSSSSEAASSSSEGDGPSEESSTTEPEVGQCVQSCLEAQDCCPVGSLGCPSEDYPNNWACEDGVCELAGCSDDLQCGLLGLTEECHAVDGVGTCFDPCGDDNDCVLMGGTCSGMADDGSRFCQVLCENDVDCAGRGTCDVPSGECVCTSDEACTDGTLDACR